MYNVYSARPRSTRPVSFNLNFKINIKHMLKYMKSTSAAYNKNNYNTKENICSDDWFLKNTYAHFFTRIGTYLALNMVARAMKQPSATRGVPVKHLSTVQSNSGPMSGLQSIRSTIVSRASSYIYMKNKLIVSKGVNYRQ